MDDFEQRITCPCCDGSGWTCSRSGTSECPVCDCRGFLIIDNEKTMNLPMQKRPPDRRARMRERQERLGEFDETAAERKVRELRELYFAERPKMPQGNRQFWNARDRF